MTSTPRVAKHRAKGRRLSAVLLCPEAIKALALLIAAKGSERAAIEYALTQCAKKQGPE